MAPAVEDEYNLRQRRQLLGVHSGSGKVTAMFISGGHEQQQGTGEATAAKMAFDRAAAASGEEDLHPAPADIQADDKPGLRVGLKNNTIQSC